MGKGVESLVEDGVAHDVGDAAVAHEAGGVEVVDVGDADEGGDADGVSVACALTGEDGLLRVGEVANEILAGEGFAKLLFVHDPGSPMMT